MRAFLIATVLFASTLFSFAQPNKGTFINATIGASTIYEYEDSDITGNGAYIQGEYVWAPKTWFGLRPYVGFLYAKGEADNQDPNATPYKLSSTAFLIGGKARFSAPIPWVAPYLELGIGASIGSFETHTPLTQLKKSGVLMHVPVSFGLAIGRHHNFDLEVLVYFHEGAEQIADVFAIGYSFPLD